MNLYWKASVELTNKRILILEQTKSHVENGNKQQATYKWAILEIKTRG
uniref:Uncharacterized protein n=1 Tax=Rhizophora mucronata TaxID=61149 RepID=A0A2P2P0T0_RHIMU